MGAAATVLAEQSPQDLANAIRNLGDEYVGYADSIEKKKVPGRVLAKLNGEEAIDKFMSNLGVPSDEMVHRMVLNDLMSNPESFGEAKSDNQTTTTHNKSTHASSMAIDMSADVPAGSVRLSNGQTYSIRENVTLPPRTTMSEMFGIQVLHADPRDVSSIAEAIAKVVKPGFGNGKDKYDCFISYRVFSEKDFALLLYLELKALRIHAFLDQKCLVAGRPWKDGFLQGLSHSIKFIPLISSKAIESFKDVSRDHRHDNVLLEFENALEIRRLSGNPDFVLPIMVGDYTKTPEGHDAFVKFTHGFNSALYSDTVCPIKEVNAPPSEVRDVDAPKSGSTYVEPISVPSMSQVPSAQVEYNDFSYIPAEISTPNVSYDDTVQSMDEREGLVTRAKILDECERYRQMYEYMYEVAKMPVELSVSERDLLAVANTNVAGPYRVACRTLIKEILACNPENIKAANHALATVLRKHRPHVYRTIHILDNFLYPNATNDENSVYYLKMKGDMYRYLAEVEKDDEHRDHMTRAMQAYSTATRSASLYLPATNKIRLGLNLNVSVFYYEVVGDKERAKTIAREAINGALAEIDSLDQITHSDSSTILQLCRENLDQWASEEDLEEFENGTRSRTAGETNAVLSSSIYDGSAIMDLKNMDNETHVYLAGLYESAELYDNMVEHTKYICKFDYELSAKERNLFSISLKNNIGALRVANRALLDALDKKTYHSFFVKPILSDIHKEMLSMCDEVIQLVREYRLPVSDSCESRVFFRKMCGDYYRWAYEIFDQDTDDGKEYFNNALEEYTSAYNLSMELAPTHPIRLGLWLNFSVFKYECARDPAAACLLAKEAFDSAIAALDSLSEEDYKDTTLIMQLLRDNLMLWTVSNEEEADAEAVAVADDVD